MHEQEKQRAYGERVRRIELATLTPLVFTCTGGAGPAATQCLKRLGSQLADKHQMANSQAMVVSRSLFFAHRFCVFMAPGLEWSRISSFIQLWAWQREACVDIFDTELTKTGLLATLFSTYRHALTSGLYPTHFWAYAPTRTSAHVFPPHMHAHTFPHPVDSSANLLLLVMSQIENTHTHE